MYTYEELEEITKSDLVKLAEYIGMPRRLNMRMLKGEMIEKILNYMNKAGFMEAEEPPMSVRVERIKEQNRS
jgi:hypothetical protein